MNSYTTIQENNSAEIAEKKSRFIAYAAHVEDEEEALAVLGAVRAEHRSARHNVYAYVLRKGSRVRYSDDGEPSKTAGLPVLETIQHAGLTDIIVVVTRYFGGTLLGTGGLVRAYTQATQAVLETAKKVKVSSCVTSYITVPYSLYDQLVYVIARHNGKVVVSDFAEQVSVEVLSLESEYQTFANAVHELLGGQGTFSSSDSFSAIF